MKLKGKEWQNALTEYQESFKLELDKAIKEFTEYYGCEPASYIKRAVESFDDLEQASELAYYEEKERYEYYEC